MKITPNWTPEQHRDLAQQASEQAALNRREGTQALASGNLIIAARCFESAEFWQGVACDNYEAACELHQRRHRATLRALIRRLCK